jgi:hypothetical protein
VAGWAQEEQNELQLAHSDASINLCEDYIMENNKTVGSLQHDNGFDYEFLFDEGNVSVTPSRVTT